MNEFTDESDESRKNSPEEKTNRTVGTDESSGARDERSGGGDGSSLKHPDPVDIGSQFMHSI